MGRMTTYGLSDRTGHIAMGGGCSVRMAGKDGIAGLFIQN